jgi:superfamily II DNA or RNA helicase
VRERSEILQKFSSGEYGVVTTSRVLNEGVDVPEARVAVVISGSGSVREHVQRLGRILRRREGKQAILYELVSSGTGEGSTSERRRAHSAYRSAGARTSDAES